MTREWSKYQAAVFEWGASGQGNGSIVAVAGSGKSTTGIELVQRLNPCDQVMFTSFTRTIVEELQRRIRELVLSNVQARTYNSFGASLINQYMSKRPVLLKDYDGQKTDQVLRYDVLGGSESKDDKDSYFRCKRAVIRTVAILKNLAIMTVDQAAAELSTVLDYYDIETPRDGRFRELVLATYAASMKRTDVIDWDDQKFFPVLFGWPIPQVDFLAVDEMQDSCVPSSTWTLTDEGPRQVRELVGKRFLITVNGMNYWTDGFYSTGRKEVFEIRTKQGYKLKATSNHPIMTKFGDQRFWQRVDELKAGSQIYLNRHKDARWEGSGTWGEGYVMGQLVGDGNISKSNGPVLEFFPPDYCVVNFVTGLLGEYNVIHHEKSGSYRVSSATLQELVNEYGMDARKEISNAIRQASSEFQRGFLSGFFDADGSLQSNHEDVNTRSLIGITMTQSDLPRLEAVQAMLLNFGIKSTIIKHGIARKEVIKGLECNVKDSYMLEIFSESSLRFEEVIGFNHPDKKSRLRYNLSQMQQMRHQEFVATITEIVSCGEEEVYDITVPGPDSFDANGFHVHNCPIEVALMLGACTAGRIAAIGDPNQAIYNFKGTRPDMMAEYEASHQATRLPLSICYRCPKAVIREAQKIVPEIEWAPDAIEGFVRTVEREQWVPGDSDMVLARCTDDLVRSVINLLGQGRAAYVVGREYGTTLKWFMEKFETPSQSNSIDNFRDRMMAHFNAEHPELVKHERDAAAIALETKVDSLKEIMIGCQTTADLRRKIDTIFTDRGNGIRHLTAHKSKGLEGGPNDDVHILRRDKLPHPRAKKAHLRAEERRLLYVAQTRTRRGLNYVKEKT